MTASPHRGRAGSDLAAGSPLAHVDVLPPFRKNELLAILVLLALSRHALFLAPWSVASGTDSLESHNLALRNQGVVEFLCNPAPARLCSVDGPERHCL